MTNLESYISSLTWFCCYLAELQRFAKMIEKGQTPSKRKVVYASSMAEKYKGYLLADKEALGYKDGFAFLENNRFDGFAILDGVIEGDKRQVKRVVNKWVKGFPESANNYEFEVGTYALALVYSSIKKGLYPDDLETRPTRSAESPAADPAA